MNEVSEKPSTAVCLNDFPLRTSDKVRYADTDRQGHVNNAVFATFLESGRVELCYNPQNPLAAEGCSFVIARLTLDFINEINWPGAVETGTRVARVGRSSITLEQAIFQNQQLVATASTVIVQVHHATRRSHPFAEAARKVFATVQQGKA